MKAVLITCTVLVAAVTAAEQAHLVPDSGVMHQFADAFLSMMALLGLTKTKPLLASKDEEEPK